MIQMFIRCADVTADASLFIIYEFIEIVIVLSCASVIVFVMASCHQMFREIVIYDSEKEQSE